MLEDMIIYTPMYITFFWAVVLLISKKENNRAKFFLGVFMFFAFLLYLSHAHFFKQISSTFYIFDPIYILSSLSVYPLYYWYIKLLSVETTYRWYNLRLLIPAIMLSLVSALIYVLMSPSERSNYVDEVLLKRTINPTDTILFKIQKINYITSRIVFIIQVVYFLIKGHRLVTRYNDKIANFYSNLENKSIHWTKYFLYLFVATSLMSIAFNFIGRGFFMNSIFLLLIPSVIFSLLLFFIGYLGYMQNHTVFDLETEENRDVIAYESDKKDNSSKLHQRLLELFEKQQIYKNPDLKITQVSEMLHTNRTYISKHINTEFSVTFSDFVNRYRIAEAKRLLTDEATMSYSLNYISEKSGFGSMGSFMRVFRDIEGVTPGQYREKTGLKNELQ